MKTAHDDLERKTAHYFFSVPEGDAMLKKIVPIITLIAGGWCASVSCADDKGDKNSEQAKAICEKFNKALFSRDVDAAMKLVATPWFDNYDATGKGAIRKDAALVKKHLEEQVETIPKAMKGEVGLKIIDNLTYEEMLTKAGDNLKPEEKKLLDEVLKKTDRVLNVRFTVDGMALSHFTMFVGWRDGEAKLVGYKELEH
jgi:hypothetical protein